MNPKFFDVKKDKQDRIINAALKLFALKGYKDSSTDVIVKEAEISKGLLFHYFISKQGLYEFVCDYSTKYMILELTRSVKSTERDFFAIFAQIEVGRTRVARNYPYMQQFLRSIRYEKDPDAVSAIGTCITDLDTTYANLYAPMNTKKFINPDDADKIIKLIDWINDGFMKEKLNEGLCDPDELNEEFAHYLELLRRHFYYNDEDRKLSIAKEDIIERDETIMDGMKMDMTFEERLEAGKRPLVEKTEEEIEAEEREKAAKEAAKEADGEDDSAEESEKQAEANGSENQESSENKVITAEDFLDEEDEEDAEVKPAGLPKVATGVITFNPRTPVATEEEAAPTIEEIIEQAEENLSHMNPEKPQE